MFHMMTTLEPIDPVLESPLSDPMARQTAAACSLLTEIAGTKVASEGMLLANLEKDGNNTHLNDRLRADIFKPLIYQDLPNNV